MELILPVEQQVYGATLDPTPTLGHPLPPGAMLRYWLAGGGKFWNKYCQSTLYWGEGGSKCTKHPNDVSITSYTKYYIVLAEFITSTVAKRRIKGESKSGACYLKTWGNASQRGSRTHIGDPSQ